MRETFIVLSGSIRNGFYLYSTMNEDLDYAPSNSACTAAIGGAQLRVFPTLQLKCPKAAGNLRLLNLLFVWFVVNLPSAVFLLGVFVYPILDCCFPAKQSCPSREFSMSNVFFHTRQSADIKQLYLVRSATVIKYIYRK